MRPRLLTGAGIVASLGALVVAVGAGGAVAKPGAKAKKVSCTDTFYNESYPSTSGFALGVLKCSKPFGAGVQRSVFKESIVGTKVTVTGAIKNFHDNGTVHGSYTLSGTLGTGPITASGPLKITGGTGAYKHTRGAGKLTCTTKDGGKTYTCTATGTATL